MTSARERLNQRLIPYTLPGFLSLSLFGFNPAYCAAAGLVVPYVIAWATVHGQVEPEPVSVAPKAELPRAPTDQADIDRVVSATHELYASLPAHGKPRVRDNGVAEWTILASISLTKNGEVTPIALGTGVKCLPAAKLPPLGDTLHDSHAEVLARRGLMRWLIAEAEAAHDGRSDFLDWDGSLFSLAPRVEVWLYVSALPCGDASTLHTAMHQDTSVREAFEAAPELTRTGDGAVRGRKGYETYGAIRTKPGRADSLASVSFSCSDKIALWSALGLQGGLLSNLFAPIYLDHIVVGGVEPPEGTDLTAYRASIVKEAQRALFGRLAIEQKPQVHLTEADFEYSKSAIEREGKAIATSPTCLSAVPSLGKNEVLVDGCVQSSAWKAPGHKLVKPKMRSRLCKYELLRAYLELSGRVRPEEKLDDKTYFELKDEAYRTRKALLRGETAPGVSTSWTRLLRNGEKFGTTQGDAPFKGWIVAGREFESFNAAGELIAP